MTVTVHTQEPSFSYTEDQFKEIALGVVRDAKRLGASDAAAEISESDGLSVTVRHGSVDTIEYHRAKMLDITLWIGTRQGHATTSDFSVQALTDTVSAAYNIARFTAEDDCAGLADQEWLEKAPLDLDLYCSTRIDPDDAINIARDAEQAAFDTDAKITRSEGASVYTQHSQFILASSQGFLGGYPSSRYCLSCVPIAVEAEQMQRDYWTTLERYPEALEPPEAVGQRAARRALARLNARRLGTRKCAVLLEAPLAASLIGAFARAISGGALYRKMSFLVDGLGKRVWAPHIQIIEDPHIARAIGSAPFDAEGVRTRRRELVKDGILQGYFLSTYAARKLKMQSTGNAGGSHNLALQSSLTQPLDDFRAMLKKLGTGLVLTELMGEGINYVTGDYSRGACGFWVEGGEIQYPVEEITVASTLQHMLANIVAIGTDLFVRGAKQTGSVLLEQMTIAGQ